ncbi:hypothetical protein HYH03_012915 [Edaphochlamys debaryana]|uniref:Uncharacterized protein n=1 Tax=Edaphochlamys debaryana TaxID=47281 RepID=A0A835XR63_9CHLO|nr:hypothetical protein HYH03_012915 [Edaphochlamys debaryana]|eukprot:KAG2488596.1 hypothetical protein HYH03_012915 [Edaphochlamys debaryana]
MGGGRYPGGAAGAAGGGRSRGRGVSPGRAGGLAPDGGVPTQVAALQGQLAVLGEQLNAAYRAAEGVVSPPRASARRGALFGGALGANASPSPGPGAGASALRGQAGVPGLGARPLAPTDGEGAGEGSLSAARLRQLAAEERAGREASAREDERLRNWIQDLRSERRRLEDRLLDSEPGASRVQQMRDDLEKQILSLSRQRDQAAAELSELGLTRSANAQLGGQVEALEQALAVEQERVVRYKEVRPSLEGRLAEVSAALEALRAQHAAAQEALAAERDAALVKARRSARRAAELDAALRAASVESRRLDEEVRAHALALAEARAGAEVLQGSAAQAQAAADAGARESAVRLAGLQAQLEGCQSDGIILRKQLEAAQADAEKLREQLREAHSRADSLAADRDKASVAAADQQREAAAAKAHAEVLQGQLRSSEEARAEAARTSAAQLEALRREATVDVAEVQKRYEAQLAASEKQYVLLQRQYDAGLASSDKASEAAAALRRERDALWAEAENLRAELEEARRDKADVAAKLAALRSEVRTTMDEVARDRDARLAAASSSSEALVRDVKAEAERRVAAVQHEYESRLSGLMDMGEKLRSEHSEATRQADKYRATANHLKDQVRDLLLSRDAAERELASERAFNEELNRILAAIRAEAAEAGR